MQYMVFIPVENFTSAAAMRTAASSIDLLRSADRGDSFERHLQEPPPEPAAQSAPHPTAPSADNRQAEQTSKPASPAAERPAKTQQEQRPEEDQHDLSDAAATAASTPADTNQEQTAAATEEQTEPPSKAATGKKPAAPPTLEDAGEETSKPAGENQTGEAVAGPDVPGKKSPVQPKGTGKPHGTDQPAKAAHAPPQQNDGVEVQPQTKPSLDIGDKAQSDQRVAREQISRDSRETVTSPSAKASASAEPSIAPTLLTAAAATQTANTEDRSSRNETTTSRRGARGTAPSSATAPNPSPAAQAGAHQRLHTEMAAAAADSGVETAPESAPTPENLTPQTSGQTSSDSGEPSTTLRLPQHVLARGSQRATKADQLSPVDQTRFIQRVAKALESMQGRTGELRIRLSPPELGSLRLEIKVQGGVMHARLEAETTMARSVLLEHLPVLRERLAEQGVRIEQFDVDLLDRQSEQSADGTRDQSQQGQRHARPTTTRQIAPAETTSNNAPPPTRPIGGQGQLNVIV